MHTLARKSELYKAVERIRRGFSRVYQWHLLRCLRHKIDWKFREQSLPVPLPTLANLHSIHDFDDRVTAPLHGFSDAEEYYHKCSSRQYLNAIRVPTLVLQSKDDPFMTQDLLPTQNELSPQVTLEITDKGGHVGFVTGHAPWRAKYWLEERAPVFLREFLEA